MYPCAAHAVDFLATSYDADVLSVDLDLPIRSEEQVVELYAQVRLGESLQSDSFVLFCACFFFPKQPSKRGEDEAIKKKKKEKTSLTSDFLPQLASLFLS